MFEGMSNKVTELDLEWIELIQEAIELGLTIDEIREFFLMNKAS